jgi:ABC-type Mn2+/Zn2+ transport system permease subunit/Mn-dependent DtxR family transcriptional regulator
MPDLSSIPAFDFYEHVVARWSGGELHATAVTVGMGILVSLACGWIGCYLILQGMALVGDAISHTVLLGIVVAFLLTGQVSGAGILAGAAITGVVTTMLIESLHTTSRIKEDAAIGIVFTSLFALGVVLLSTFAGGAHIDTQHILYGALEVVALEPTVAFAGMEIPLQVCQMALIAAAVLTLIVAFYKELLVVSFDSQLAASLGFAPRLVRYGLMAVLSLTVVAAFDSVGAVLVVAMLIAPAATAYLLTHRLPTMMVVSAIVGAFSALVGYHLAYWLEASAAGAMVAVACTVFALAFFVAPKQGLIATAARRLRLRLRMSQENIIRQILKLAAGKPQAAVEPVQIVNAMQIPRWQFHTAVRALKHRGWVEPAPELRSALRLTPRGQAQAERLDRAHRLWETYLVEKVGLPSDHVHPAAEQVEHLLSEQLVERVDDALGHPVTDPHGAPIPRSAIADSSGGNYTLSKLRIGDRARVVGLVESGTGTPAAPAGPLPAASQVADLGLTLGQTFEVIERTAEPPSWGVALDDGRQFAVPHESADLVLVQIVRRAKGEANQPG